MESEEISYLLSLPDDVLIYKIFPQYDVSYLLHLCEINKRFSIICQDNHLWEILTERDFGINPIPEGFNNWRDIYLYYKNLLHNPIEAIPYLEDALLLKRSGVTLSPLYHMLIITYRDAISYLSYGPGKQGQKIAGFEHNLVLYNPEMHTFSLPTSPEQIRILHPNENVWRNINQGGFNRLVDRMNWTNSTQLPSHFYYGTVNILNNSGL
jgi:hypothetical protein